MNIGFKTRIYLGVGLLVTISTVLGTLNILSMKEKMITGLVVKLKTSLIFMLPNLSR